MLNVSIAGYASWATYDTFLIMSLSGRPVYDPNPLRPNPNPKKTVLGSCRVHGLGRTLTPLPMVNKTFHTWIVVVLTFKVCYITFLSLSLSLSSKEARVCHFRWCTHVELCGTCHAAWTWLHLHPLTIFFLIFFFLPMWPNTVQNRTQYEPKYLLKKKNINFKLIFYLVLVSNSQYCILIYEHHVMVIYSLYYLLLLLNWYMFTIIRKKNV